MAAGRHGGGSPGGFRFDHLYFLSLQAVAEAIAKATWAWVRGKCEEAMREVLGAGRGVQAGEAETPAMAAEARRETRRGAEGDEEGDGGDGAQDSERVRLRNTY